MSAPQPLYLRHLAYRVPGHTLLQGVDATLHPGELCALIGPSGAGKSTLLRLLLGLIEPAEGGVRLGTRRVEPGASIGYVPQDDALHRSLTVRQSLDYAVRLRAARLDDDRRRRLVRRLLHKVGLQERADLRISRLSGGQRKRVSVAMELVTHPHLLILDEPTSGLDPGMEAQMMQLFAEVADSGRVVMVATHSMQSLALCHQLLVLQAGRMVWFGPPAAALEHFGVGRHEALFARLAEREAVFWAERYRQSAFAREVAARPLPTPPTAAPVDVPPSDSASPPQERAAGAEDRRDSAAILARLRQRRGGQQGGADRGSNDGD